MALTYLSTQQAISMKPRGWFPASSLTRKANGWQKAWTVCDFQVNSRYQRRDRVSGTKKQLKFLTTSSHALSSFIICEQGFALVYFEFFIIAYFLAAGCHRTTNIVWLQLCLNHGHTKMSHITRIPLPIAALIWIVARITNYPRWI